MLAIFTGVEIWARKVYGSYKNVLTSFPHTSAQETLVLSRSSEGSLTNHVQAPFFWF